MKAAQSLIKAAIQSAAAAVDLDMDSRNVTFTPCRPAPAGAAGYKPAAIEIDWSTGPAWGKLRLEWRPLPGHLVSENQLAGLWIRANGVAVTPAGFAILPALNAALAEIATAGLRAADYHLPDGIPAPSAA
jgi:hypothetical protein